ncbi:ComEC/Rec2 family competence protein [Demequina sp. NBRC 110055]|uniref:ComEC/Rec2 family competence protein n=1 Tax=Demequina sp. NBRC 110055 TaxID=1570344 RepID=UPI0009FDE71A|nr:ComEC/Rec2 family competence protein [Demequina sp. NBRC 110055]
MRPAHDARLIPAASGAWAGCVAAQIAGSTEMLVAVVLAAAVVAATVHLCAQPGKPAPGEGAAPSAGALARSGAAAAVLAAVACAMGAASASLAETASDASVPMGAAATHVRGTVDAAPRDVALRGTDVAMVDLTLDAWRPSDTDAWQATTGRVTAVLQPGTVRRDEAVEVVGELDAGDDGPVMWEATLVDRAEAPGYMARARRWLADVTARLPDDRGGLLRGMLTGDTSAMPQDQVDAMRTSGLAHLTAVSGAHFAVVTMLVLTVTRAARVPRGVTAATVAAAAGVFSTFVGPAPSVARATVMALVVAAAVALGRKARGLPALAGAILGVVATAPMLTVEIGFVMSVVAVTAIVLWAPVLARRLGRVLAPRAARAVSVPLAAQLALTPLLLTLQPGVSAFAVPANLAVVPFLVPVMVMGVAASAVGPALPGVGEALVVLADLAVQPIAAVAATVAALPGARLAWPGGAGGISLAIGVVVGAVIASMASLRRVRWLATAATVVAVAAGVVPGVLPEPVTDEWDVVMCDVGQGDMTLVRTGPSSAVVIDTGKDEDRASSCLRRYGVTDVPLLVLTHPHADHDGAVAAVVRETRVTRVWVSAAGRDGRAYRAVAERGIAAEVPEVAASLIVEGTHVDILSEDHLDADIGNPNDASLVTLVTTPRVSVLGLGDLEPEAQRRLAARLGPLQVDVVKIAHHGSGAQDPGLARLLRADLGLIGAGADNDYGHPARAALDLYGPRVDTLAVTATCGDVVATANADAAMRVGCRTGMAP